MAEYRLGEVEMKFADIIWENEPIASGELVKLSEQKLNWKKSTIRYLSACVRGRFFRMLTV